MAQTGNITFGDTVYVSQVSSACSTAFGIDSNDNKFKLSTSLSIDGDAIPSTNPNIIIDTAASGDVTVLPNIPSGNLVLNNGNFDIPETTIATNGSITMDGTRLLHVGSGGIASNSVFLGIDAGNYVVTGTHNTGIGRESLETLTSGSYNVALGDRAGENVTVGSSNVLVNHVGVFNENNTTRLGTTGNGNGQQNRCFIAGVDGINVGSVSKVLTMASEQVGTANLSAGIGISITPSANTITFAATGGGINWNVITAASQGLLSNNGYISNRAGLITYTLPATANVGDIIRITLINAAGSWTIVENAGQIIKFGDADTTTTTGSLSSTANGDTVELLCTVTDTNFIVLSSVGNITFI